MWYKQPKQQLYITLVLPRLIIIIVSPFETWVQQWIDQRETHARTEIQVTKRVGGLNVRVETDPVGLST